MNRGTMYLVFIIFQVVLGCGNSLGTVSVNSAANIEIDTLSNSAYYAGLGLLYGNPKTITSTSTYSTDVNSDVAKFKYHFRKVNNSVVVDCYLNGEPFDIEYYSIQNRLDSSVSNRDGTRRTVYYYQSPFNEFDLKYAKVNGEIEMQNHEEYDTINRRRYSIGDDGIVSITTYYDSMGRVVKRHSHNGDIITDYLYNEMGFLKEETTYPLVDSNMRKSATYIYEYDSHNNWISKSMNLLNFSNHTATSTTKRTIIYY